MNSHGLEFSIKLFYSLQVMIQMYIFGLYMLAYEDGKVNACLISASNFSNKALTWDMKRLDLVWWHTYLSNQSPYFFFIFFIANLIPKLNVLSFYSKDRKYFLKFLFTRNININVSNIFF